MIFGKGFLHRGITALVLFQRLQNKFVPGVQIPSLHNDFGYVYIHSYYIFVNIQSKGVYRMNMFL